MLITSLDCYEDLNKNIIRKYFLNIQMCYYNDYYLKCQFKKSLYQ